VTAARPSGSGSSGSTERQAQRMAIGSPRSGAVPGQLMLATRPALTGSSPTLKTIGIVEVAALAARARGGLPGTAITATLRRTRSAASCGCVGTGAIKLSE